MSLRAARPRLVVSDINSSMLEVGKDRARQHPNITAGLGMAPTMEWVEADAGVGSEAAGVELWVFRWSNKDFALHGVLRE